ncbi:universal stress protein [Carnobacterium gallinarum]|uniref:universal stress protein n=1 Tax=Carnobacterium gallinarum TaxID=2749 RepID=UPI00054CF668|nr:universal stress protein [Carnobacterium gallinarum]
MNEKIQEYQRIMVAVDGSPESENALDKAIETAKRNNAELLIVHVIDNRNYTMGVVSFDIEASGDESHTMQEALATYQKQASENGVKKVYTELVTGSPKELLAKKLPKEYQIDLIFCGQSGMNQIERIMMGSISQFIIREASCDVLVVRGKEKKTK